MIKDTWNDLIIHNPMLIEVTRFRRRFLSASSAGSANGIILILCLICYATVVLVVIENRDSISPIALIGFETVLLSVLAPILLYNAIAGERERRSWDLLLAAPITKTQIVVGKFMGAMAALGVAVVLFQVPILISARSFERAHFVTVLNADFLSVTFLMFVCSLTILFSARVKRGLMALGATLGSLISVLIVLPAILAGGNSDRHYTDVAFFLHPFIAFARLYEVDDYLFSQAHSVVSVSTLTKSFTPATPSFFEGFVQPIWWGWPQALTYLALAIVCLGWASNTLNFAENEVKFLPHGHKDA